MNVLPLHAQPGGKVVHPHKHRPGAMCASLAAKRIDSIGARAQHDVPWIVPKFWVFEVQRLPLARILRVTQHLVFFIYLRIICVIFSLLLLPIRVPTQELCYLRVREIPLQTRSDRKVPHHFSRSFLPLLVSSDAAHRTYGRLRVLAPINDAIVHAHMVFHVR